MSSHSNSLVGRTFRAMIAEPWDFVSDAGDNILEGRIIELSSNSDPWEWIKCEIIPFRVGKITVREVAIVRRYAEPDGIADQLEKGKELGVNIIYDPNCGVLSTEKLRMALRKKAGLSFLAGSVKLT